jgi:hypothetical protein
MPWKQLAIDDREALIHHLAGWFASEFTECERDHFEATHGWSTDDYEFMYHVVRTQQCFAPYPLFPLDQASDEQLTTYYSERFGEYLADAMKEVQGGERPSDPDYIMADLWFCGLVFNSAFGGYQKAEV